MQTLITVPARFGSTRFPGKPLAEIAGHPMILRVGLRAKAAAERHDGCDYVIATDDARIESFCREAGLNVVMTPDEVATGSDRALAAADALGREFDYVLNLQGDAPFTPLDHISAIISALQAGKGDVVTPYIRLSWDALDRLRATKQETPFSGTTCIIDEDGAARWFSKTILPAIRHEAALREASELSPVCRHIGLYGFRLETLRKFVSLPPSPYEQLEGLEQLRLLENGIGIHAVEVAAPPVATSGIDTPEDIARVEAMIARLGDPDSEFLGA